MGPITTAISETYNQFPTPLKAALNAAVGKIVAGFAARAGRKVGNIALGDRGARAIERALKAAIASVISQYEDLEAVGIGRYLAEPPVSHFITDLLENPAAEVDPDELRQAIDRAGLDFEPSGVDAIELIDVIRRELLREIRNRPETRELYDTVRLDQVLAGVESLHREFREHRNDASGRPMASVPTLPDWSAESLGGLLRSAREAMRDGQLDEAEVILRRQLDVVRNARRAAAGAERADDPARRRHEQDLLLALGQLAVRRNQQRRALEFVRKAEGLGPVEGRSRYFAGWILLNIGRAERAREVLTPDDGSPEWRDTLAVAHLMVGDDDSFHALVDATAVENPDVLLALVRHHTEAGELGKAEFFAERVARDAGGGPVELVRALEAASALVTHFAWGDAPKAIDVERWLESLRAWFSRVRAEVGEGHVFLHREALWHDVSFHLLLLETERATAAWRELARIAPSDAAQFAAFGPVEAAPDEINALLGAVDDPVLSGMLRARLAAVRGDLSGAVTRLHQLRLTDGDPRRDHVTAMRIELEMEVGGDVNAAMAELNTVADPVTRAIVESTLVAADEGSERALQIVQRVLEEQPQNLRLLRSAYLHAMASVHSQGSGLGVDRDLAVEIAGRLVERLPCPEHRIMRARALWRAGRAEEALDEVRAVEAAGYVTEETVRLIAGLAAELRRLGERATATRRLFEQFDGSDEVGLEAARSAIFAGDYATARELLERLRHSEKRETALAAYSMLAAVAEAAAEDRSTGREEAVRVLIQGYDRLGGPVELAGPMYLRALDTPLAREAAARIKRDHGSLDALPGVQSFSTEQVIEIMREDRKIGKMRSEAFMAGLLPFDRFAEISPRNASYLWFAHRFARVPHLIEPPRFPSAVREDDAPLLPPLLFDRTALLLLAELDLLDVVLNSRLEVLLHRHDFDWLAQEEVEALASHRPGELNELRGLIRFIETGKVAIAEVDSSDERFWAMVEDAGGGVSGLELAIAERDGLAVLDDLEDGERFARASIPVLCSPDVLHVLTPEPVSYGEAEHAREIAPSVFAKSRGTGGIVLDQPVLVGMGTLRAWHEAGLLNALVDAVPRVVVSPATHEHIRERVAEQEAYGSAVEAVRMLRTRIADAVERTRVRLVGGLDSSKVGVGESAGGMEDPSDGGGRDSGRGEDVPENNEERVGAWMTEPLIPRYAAAVAAGAALCSSDAATHLYLHPLGPLIPGMTVAQQRTAELRAEFPGLQVIGVSEVLRWLEEEGVIDRAERLDRLADLVRHGRLLPFDSELVERELRDAAKSDATEAAETLTALEQVPVNLHEGAVLRFMPTVIGVIASALGALATRDDVTVEQLRRGVGTAVRVLGAWLVRSGDRAR
ncbi:MAG TPA: hypothetical protein VF190_07450, partial [Rhodothermales bacterium]